MEINGDFNRCYNGLLEDSLLSVLAEDLSWKQPPHTIHRTPHRFQNDIFFAWAKRGTIGSPSTGDYARWLESCSRSMAFQDFGAQRVPWQKDVIRHYGLWGWPPSAHLQQHRLMWRNLYRRLHSACTYARLHNLCGHLFISLDGGLAWICQLLEVPLKLLIAFIAALDFGNERVCTVSCTSPPCDGEFTGILGVEPTPFTSEDQPLGTKRFKDLTRGRF